MIFLIYSETTDALIERNLGMSEYSYYFVLKEFRPVLERLGIVVTITDVQREVDRVWRNAALHGERCIFLSFSPPHRTTIDLACPTLSVFAWEFDTLPSEGWAGEPRNDWRVVLRRLGRAITHSAFTVETVKKTLGESFPVVSIPAPVWDRFDKLRCRYPATPVCAGVDLSVVGTIIDSRTVDLEPYAPALKVPDVFPPLPPECGPDDPARAHIDGVVYTAVFNPYDNRKNWFDMICGFCLTFRDVPDATLILKLTHQDRSTAMCAILEDLYKVPPFRCRVIMIHGYLVDEDYEKLVGATSFAVSTSRGEGQCLPLMEFMSAGRPAISPTHTAMADYITADNAFMLDSSLEAFHWPQDPRQAYRSRRGRINFATVLEAYDESYRVAKGDPVRYARMSRQANLDLERHCSQAIAEARLRDFLGLSVDTERTAEAMAVSARSVA